MNKIYLIILFAVLGITSFLLYNKLGFLNITVRFDDLEPLEKQMNVYYKGFKIGKTTKIYPDRDYLNTYVNLKIKPHDIKLPSNIMAVIKRTPSREYVSIIYPDAPSLTRIKNDMVIQGKAAKDLKSVINESVEGDDIDEIIDEATTLMESANNTVQNAGEMFTRLNKILDNINDDITKSASNISRTTQNVAQISDNLNNAIGREETKQSFENIEQTTENIKNITSNINNITEQMEQETMPIINSVLCETNSTMENAEEITNGIKNTLSKRMGLWKLMFGKPIKCE